MGQAVAAAGIRVAGEGLPVQDRGTGPLGRSPHRIECGFARLRAGLNVSWVDSACPLPLLRSRWPRASVAWRQLVKEQLVKLLTALPERVRSRRNGDTLT